MKILEELSNDIDFKNASLALGFFDGVHTGHRAVIKSAVQYAKMNNTKSAVITFQRHPQEIFGGDCKYINTREQRAKLISELDVDYLFELDFTSKLAQKTGEEYLKMIVEYFKPKYISTGFNHTFGIKLNGIQSGNPELLEYYQEKYGYKYTQIPPQTMDDEVISSSKIKSYLSIGEIEKANKMLGYEFSINGTVIHGNHIGRTIGFPTANIKYPQNIIEIPYGAYSTTIFNKKAVTNYGKKPTIGNNIEPVAEAHILNFDKDIYNTNIEIKFIKRIREEQKFSSVEELKEQINKDIQEC